MPSEGRADPPGPPTPSRPPPPPPSTPPPPVPPPGAAPGDAGFSQPRPLHPASVVLGLSVRQFVQGLLIPAFAGVAASPEARVTVVVLAGLLAIGLVVRILGWQRFRFSFDGDVLRVSEGVLRRNHRSLDVGRIQQVEVDRSLVQRMLGLAAIRVETAGASSAPEVELRVLPERDAHALRDALRAGKARATGEVPIAGSGAAAGVASGTEDADRAPLLHVGVGHILLASVTGNRLLVLPAVLAGALQFLGDGDGAVDATTLIRGVLELGMILLVLLLIPATLVSAAVVGVLRDFDWTLRRVGDDLHVSRGLLSTRESVVPLSRVQHVEVQRNLFRRALGFASVRVHSAGGGGGGGDRRITVPLLPDAAVDRLVGHLLPGVPGIPELVRHPPAARRRAIFRAIRGASIPALALALVPRIPDELRWAAVALLASAVVLGVIEHRWLAHGRTERVVAARRGALSLSTGVVPLVKVQAVSTGSNWFQRRLGLVTVTAHVAGPGGDLDVLDCGRDAGERLQVALTRSAADPIVPAEVAAPDTGVPVPPEDGGR